MTQTDVRLGADELAGLVRSCATDPSPAALEELGRRADEVSARAFGDGDPAAELEAQRFLYEVHAHRILPPWSPEWRDYTDPAIVAAHRRVGDAWLARDREVYGAGLEVPTTPEGFGRWATVVCEEHASGVTHPLFDFLAEKATFAQLRDFQAQETPFDIHFGDLVALLLPGIHGGQKIELAGNFWDEMGNGKLAGTHRQLRLDMMAARRRARRRLSVQRGLLLGGRAADGEHVLPDLRGPQPRTAVDRHAAGHRAGRARAGWSGRSRAGGGSA